MKVDFVLVGYPAHGYGPRVLSGLLRNNGHATRLLYVPHPRAKGIGAQYPMEVIESIKEFCRQSDMVCISAAEGEFFHRQALIQILTELGTIQVFREVGGNTATIHPSTFYGCAEAVCVGEGESALLELVMRLDRNDPYKDVHGFHFPLESEIVKNPPVREKDLDSLGTPDFGPDDHFILGPGGARPLRSEDLLSSQIPLRKLIIATSRGCSLSCSFCKETLFVKNLDGVPRLRTRGLPAVFEELLAIRKAFPDLQYIEFYDEDFFIRSLSQVKKFSEFYRREIGLPFGCLAKPGSIDRQKMEYLLDAGMSDLAVGMQSGSDRINRDVYYRRMSREMLDGVVSLLNGYRYRVHIRYLMIMRNPWETGDDLLATLSLMKQVEAPAYFEVNPLEFIPGTTLYEREVSAGRLAPFSSMESYDGFGTTASWQPGKSRVNYSFHRSSMIEREGGGCGYIEDALDAILLNLHGNWSSIRRGWLPRGTLGVLVRAATSPLAPLMPWLLYTYASIVQEIHAAIRKVHGRIFRTLQPSGPGSRSSILSRLLYRMLWQ